VGADARVREALDWVPRTDFFQRRPALERHRMRHHLFELTQEAGGWSDIHMAGKMARRASIRRQASFPAWRKVPCGCALSGAGW
jgi:hypothetical protein